MSVAFCCTHFLLAQSPAVLKVRQYRQANEHAIISEFVSFLKLPNIVGDTIGIYKNASFIMDAMKKRGIANVQLLTPATNKAVPAVYGEVITPSATQTIIFYAHYDGQPVNAAQWAKGLSPFEPKLLTTSLEQNGSFIEFPTPDKAFDPQWRIYGRSASDDKAGVMAILNAYDAIVKSGMKPTVNIKFFFEGEEEAGSPNLEQILNKYQSTLNSDLWIICDGPVHQSSKKQLVIKTFDTDENIG